MDRYVELLTLRGSKVSECLQAPGSHDDIQALCSSTDVDPPAEVRDLWAWRNGGGGWSLPDLFWETGELLSVAAATALRLDLQKAVDETDPDFQWLERADELEAFPGPTRMLPLLMLDEREIVFVDCGPDTSRGSLWFGYSSEALELIFHNLEEAIDAATYAVEAGIWRVGASQIECDRESMPTTEDRDNPPWAVIDEADDY